MQVSMEQFVAAFATDEQGEHIATIIREAKEAAAAKKSTESGLFAGFLALCADGVKPAAIRAAAADVRAAVTRALRVAGGFPPVAKKGDGGPDYSTPSVYAGIVCAAIEARRDEPELWAAACDAYAKSKKTAPETHAASGFFATKSALSAAVEEFREMQANAVRSQYPSLAAAHAAPLDDILTRLERERDAARADANAARAQVASMLEHADADGSLRAARAERDAVQAELIAAHAAAAELRERIAQLEAAAAARETADAA